MFCFNRSRLPVFILTTQDDTLRFALCGVTRKWSWILHRQFFSVAFFFRGGKKIWDFQKPEAQEGNELWSKNGNGG